MNKRIVATTFGATMVGLLIGSTFGLTGGASAKSAANSSISVRVQHDNGGAGEKSGHLRGGGKNLDAIATILKLTADELHAQLESGKTLAQVATAQKVDIKLVTDEIIKNIKAHIAKEVASGEITQAQADTKLAGLTAKVTEMVNTVRPARGEGGHHGRGHRHGFGETPSTTKTSTQTSGA